MFSADQNHGKSRHVAHMQAHYHHEGQRTTDVGRGASWGSLGSLCLRQS